MLSTRQYEAARTAFLTQLSYTEHLGNTLNDAYGSARIPRETLPELGYTLLVAGDSGKAHRYFAEALAMFRRAGMRRRVAWVLEGMASVADAPHPVRAARLWGAAEALREQIGAPMWPVDRPEYERRVAEARAALGDDAFDTAWAAGRALTWEQAADEALAWLGVSPNE